MAGLSLKTPSRHHLEHRLDTTLRAKGASYTKDWGVKLRNFIVDAFLITTETGAGRKPGVQPSRRGDRRQGSRALGGEVHAISVTAMLVGCACGVCTPLHGGTG